MSAVSQVVLNIAEPKGLGILALNETIPYRRRYETKSFHPFGSGEMTRPRIEGAREREIFDAAIQLLGEVGYDRVTLDELAVRASASKASLYRRWGDKSALVNAAISAQAEAELNLPDTGSVIDDLSALCASPGFFDVEDAAVVSGLATTLHREPDQHEAIRRKLLHDGTKHVGAILARAVDRGELPDDLDVDLLSSVIPAMVLFQMTYRTPGRFDEDFVSRVVTDVLSPALRHQSPEENHGSAHRR